MPSLSRPNSEPEAALQRLLGPVIAHWSPRSTDSPHSRSLQFSHSDLKDFESGPSSSRRSTSHSSTSVVRSVPPVFPMTRHLLLRPHRGPFSPSGFTCWTCSPRRTPDSLKTAYTAAPPYPVVLFGSFSDPQSTVV